MRIRRLNLYSFRMSDPIPCLTTEEDVVLSLLTESTLELSEVIGEQISNSRFHHGNICFCLLHQKKVVSYCWIAFDEEWIREIEMLIKPKDREAYLFDAFTLPEYRGKNLFPTVLSNTLNYLKAKGYHRVLIFALNSNRASIKAIQKASFRHFQCVIFLKLFGKGFHLISKGLVDEEPVYLQ